MIELTLPLSRQKAQSLRAGDLVSLTGSLLTGRDAAHQRLCQCVATGEPLPVPLNGQVLYYVGPAPARPGQVCGPAGPTSSYRMDAFTPQLIAQGLIGMIGKGTRSPQVVEAMQQYGAVYFAAVGGAAALLAQHITAVKVLCYEDLGTEAVHQFQVENFPVVVAIDSQGNNLYDRTK